MDPLVELTALPRPHSWIKGSLLLREGDGKEMEGEVTEGCEGEVYDHSLTYCYNAEKLLS